MPELFHVSSRQPAGLRGLWDILYVKIYYRTQTIFCHEEHVVKGWPQICKKRVLKYFVSVLLLENPEWESRSLYLLTSSVISTPAPLPLFFFLLVKPQTSFSIS